MNTMNHLTILLVFEVLLLVQSNTLTCEPFGVCAISINETEFSCGENYENVTRADNLLDLKVFWSCVCGYGNLEYDLPESERDVLVFLFFDRNCKHKKRKNLSVMPEGNTCNDRCKIGIIVKKVFICYQSNEKLQLLYRTITHTPISMLAECLIERNAALSTLSYIRMYGNLISSEISIAGTRLLDDAVLELSFDNNQITFVKKSYFSNYTVLRVLSLSKNQITTIEIDALPSTGSLEVLDIRNNYLDCNTSCYLMGWNTVWENVSILAEYNADRKIPSINNYQQCLEDICTADNDKLSTAMASATMTGTADNDKLSTAMASATMTGTADNDKLSTAMASATMTGTAVNNNIYEIMPTATITDIQITMVIIGLLLGTSAIIGITSLIRKMFGNGSMNTQENDNTEVVMENERDYEGEKPVEFIRAKGGILFKNIPPLAHHDI